MPTERLVQFRRPFVVVILTGLLLTIGFSRIVAQGNVIAYGESVTGTIDASMPVGFFNFSGTVGDLITVRAIGLSGELDPNVGLLSPTQAQLAANDNDFFSPGSSDARISLRLPETGTYSLIVGGSNATTGDFLLRVDMIAPSVSTGLSTDSPTSVNVPLGAPSQVYSFEGSQTINLSTESPDFGFTAIIRDASGRIIAILGGDVLQAASLTLGAGGPYEVTVSSSNAETQGVVNISLGDVAVTDSTDAGSDTATDSGETSASAPVATEDSAPADAGDPLAGIGPDAICTVTPNAGTVNLRAGAGTNFNVQGQLNAGQSANPDGQALGNDGFVWFRLPSTAWVRSDVVRSAGNCNGLADVSSPDAPAQQSAPPATTEEGSASSQPTEVAPPPPTEETPPPLATAPQDTGQFFFDVTRDQSSQFSEQISFPEGDTQDQVFFRITDLSQFPPNNNREFTFTLTCTGTGSEDLRWGTGVNTNRSCGDSITRFFTDDSDQQLFTISLTGGGPSLVNYTLIAANQG